MPDFWISNGFVVICDGNTLLRVEHTALTECTSDGCKIEVRRSGI